MEKKVAREAESKEKARRTKLIQPRGVTGVNDSHDDSIFMVADAAAKFKALGRSNHAKNMQRQMTTVRSHDQIVREKRVSMMHVTLMTLLLLLLLLVVLLFFVGAAAATMFVAVLFFGSTICSRKLSVCS
jgi:flagellar biosynthesis protein FlhB